MMHECNPSQYASLSFLFNEKSHIFLFQSKLFIRFLHTISTYPFVISQVLRRAFHFTFLLTIVKKYKNSFADIKLLL